MMRRADLPVAQILREDSAEEEFMPQASAEEPFQDSISNGHPLVLTPLSADQWRMINQIDPTDEDHDHKRGDNHLETKVHGGSSSCAHEVATCSPRP